MGHSPPQSCRDSSRMSPRSPRPSSPSSAPVACPRPHHLAFFPFEKNLCLSPGASIPTGRVGRKGERLTPVQDVDEPLGSERVRMFPSPHRSLQALEPGTGERLEHADEMEIVCQEKLQWQGKPGRSGTGGDSPPKLKATTGGGEGVGS